MNSLPNEIKLTYLIAIFVMMLLVVFIFIMISIYNKRQQLYTKEKQLNEAKHQNELLQELVARQEAIQKERERISHDMHDELGAGISALKLQVEFLKNKIKDEHINPDIDDLMETSEEMNKSMREMLWSLNAHNDNLGNFVDYVCQYVENFLMKSPIEAHCKFECIQPETVILSNVRRNLLLCIKEAVNNVYKHSDAKNVYLNFYQENQKLIIDIIDDGVGLSNEKTGGNGMKNMKIRMENIKGFFEIIPSQKGLHLKYHIDLA